MNDSLFCTISMNLKKHKMKLLETVIITDRDRKIRGMKVIMRMLNKSTLFSTSSDFSDILIVNYDFDDYNLFSFKNVDDSYVVSDQKYIRKYTKLLKNTEMPVEMLVDQFTNGVLRAFLNENEIKIEYVSPLIVERAFDDYIEKFRRQTLFRKS